MAKNFTQNHPAINMTMVGFGNAGSRMADEFAAYTLNDKKPAYNCLALNSNTGDLEALKYIPEENRVSLNLGGLGKNPEKAKDVLSADTKAKEQLKSFIKEKIRPQDELVLFFAGLGGGTGTATIVEAIEDFYEYTNKPIIAKELDKIRNEVSSEELRANQKKYVNLAFQRAQDKFIKIGVIVTLPRRSDGPDVLRQVNKFATKIWDLANRPEKGIAFVTFADNQHFYDKFTALPAAEKKGITNYRDYGNKQIAEILHELNTATTAGGSAVLLDSQDFRRALLQYKGSLVLSKKDTPINQVKNGDDLVGMFKESFKQSNLHSPLQLVTDDNGKRISKKVHHVGMLAVLDGKNEFGHGAFIDDAVDNVTDTLPINGTVFSGYINSTNDFNATVYTFYKVEGLPERLEIGLVEEYQSFMDKQKQTTFESAEIKQLDNDDVSEFNIDLEDLGLAPLFNEEPNEVIEEENEDTPSTEDLLASLDFSDIKG